MTPKMLNALREAAAFDRTGGLHRSNAGWAVNGTVFGWHNFRTVDALLGHGYLKVWGGGRGVPLYACITDAGTAALQRAGYEADGSKA